MQLGGELVFTVRKAAPIRLTQAQVLGLSAQILLPSAAVQSALRAPSQPPRALLRMQQGSGAWRRLKGSSKAASAAPVVPSDPRDQQLPWRFSPQCRRIQSRIQTMQASSPGTRAVSCGCYLVYQQQCGCHLIYCAKYMPTGGGHGARGVRGAVARVHERICGVPAGDAGGRDICRRAAPGEAPHQRFHISAPSGSILAPDAELGPFKQTCLVLLALQLIESSVTSVQSFSSVLRLLAADAAGVRGGAADGPS